MKVSVCVHVCSCVCACVRVCCVCVCVCARSAFTRVSLCLAGSSAHLSSSISVSPRGFLRRTHLTGAISAALTGSDCVITVLRYRYRHDGRAGHQASQDRSQEGQQRGLQVTPHLLLQLGNKINSNQTYLPETPANSC